MVKDKREGNKWHVFATIQNENSTNQMDPLLTRDYGDDPIPI